jgi:hypothetical protein
MIVITKYAFGCNVQIQDLLDTRSADCVIREDRHHNIYVGGLSEKRISTVEDFNASFIPASRNRYLSECREVIPADKVSRAGLR